MTSQTHKYDSFRHFQMHHNLFISWNNLIKLAASWFDRQSLSFEAHLLFGDRFEHNSKYIEDIYFFEVNTKYISSSVLTTSEFSWVRSTNENFDVFNSRDDIYLVFTKKSKFSFYFILFRRFTVNLLTMLQAESK